MLRPTGVPHVSASARRRFGLAFGMLLALGLAESRAHAAETLVVPPKLRLLVVAPHPDDESLAAGGLMQQTLAAGGRVHVLFLTNGDGYPEALEAARGPGAATAAAYRAFGERRHTEAMAALGHYRLPPGAATFLGFPDGGLAEIWRRGPQGAAYASPFTHAETPPYRYVLDRRARYVSGDLVAAIARTVARSDPHWIVLPTPLDHHLDHCSTFTLVVAALRVRAAAPGGGDGTRPERLLTYMVHTASGWPPPGQIPGALPEPAKPIAPARWFSLALNDAQVEIKRQALAEHRTQVAVMETLFHSFTRPNELFGVIEHDQIPGVVADLPTCGEAAPAQH